MKPRALIAAAVLAAAAAGEAGAAEPTLLKFAYPAPPQGWVIDRGLNPWVKRVEAAADGALEIRVYPGSAIANFRNVYDRLLNGVAEFAFGTFGAIEDQFPKSSVTGLPFLADTSAEAGLALWRLYESGVAADEYARVKPIAMFGFGDTGLHFTKPVTRLDELKGMKVFANGRSITKVLAAVGAVSITSNPGELYQGLSRGLAEGAAFTWPGIQAFKLTELIKDHLDVPFGKTGGYFFMNKDAYAKLPEKSRAAVDRHSGEVFTKLMGKGADEEDASQRDQVLAHPGQTNRALSAADLERMKQMVAPLIEEWAAATPDGARVLAAYRAELERIRKGS
jgi:TRAP-type C4-dicarboxylate transport system substrate-binding protein